jgi:GNAT superfamily N-acetyltransferase
MTISNHQEFTTIQLDTDAARLDRSLVQRTLAATHWASGIPQDVIPQDVIDRSIAGSLAFGLYDGDAQIGFCRVVTDRATFAWLCDVFVLPSHQRRGLARWMVQEALDHHDLRGLRRVLLATRDAHRVYEACGFGPLQTPFDRWMEIVDRDVYARSR